MDNWDEIRTAYHVARAGTVSGAAAEMGVHHATVIRHIDALEARLGTKLFQRHARGYTPTEAGLDLLQVARATDEQFAQLANRIKGQGETVSGELVVTSLTSFSPFLAPVLTRFQKLISPTTWCRNSPPRRSRFMPAGNISARWACRRARRSLSAIVSWPMT